ncbi:hypothetical protein Pelo_624 [Pelomyxa schiedti]|nr:hypothetical protein Pelo_624 [Pelomyxa schiedti]
MQLFGRRCGSDFGIIIVLLVVQLYLGYHWLSGHYYDVSLVQSCLDGEGKVKGVMQGQFYVDEIYHRGSKRGYYSYAPSVVYQYQYPQEVGRIFTGQDIFAHRRRLEFSTRSAAVQYNMELESRVKGTQVNLFTPQTAVSTIDVCIDLNHPEVSFLIPELSFKPFVYLLGSVQIGLVLFWVILLVSDPNAKWKEHQADSEGFIEINKTSYSFSFAWKWGMLSAVVYCCVCGFCLNLYINSPVAPPHYYWYTEMVAYGLGLFILAFYHMFALLSVSEPIIEVRLLSSDSAKRLSWTPFTVGDKFEVVVSHTAGIFAPLIQDAQMTLRAEKKESYLDSKGKKQHRTISEWWVKKCVDDRYANKAFTRGSTVEHRFEFELPSEPPTTTIGDPLYEWYIDYVLRIEKNPDYSASCQMKVKPAGHKKDL